MSEYKLIVEYYFKGNNNTQIATLCSCSRTTVWTVLKRFRVSEIIFADVEKMSEPEFALLLFPERMKTGQGYLIPDFKWEEFQMIKHRASIRLCWRRYCKRAEKKNLAAYSWKSFLCMYNAYRRPELCDENPHDRIRLKLKHYNFLLKFFEGDDIRYTAVKIEKKRWLKSLRLEEDKIIDNFACEFFTERRDYDSTR